MVAAGADYVSKPARRYREEGWDLEYVQFMYRTVKVEVGNAEGARIFDAGSGQWVALHIDFAQTCYAEVLGVEVPLMKVEDLIRYKKILDRPVDREDIVEVTARV